MFLWTRTGQPPPEYLAYRLRMLYGVPPWEFEKHAKGKHLLTMMRDLVIAGLEIKVENQRAKLKG